MTTEIDFDFEKLVDVGKEYSGESPSLWLRHEEAEKIYTAAAKGNFISSFAHHSGSNANGVKINEESSGKCLIETPASLLSPLVYSWGKENSKKLATWLENKVLRRGDSFDLTTDEIVEMVNDYDVPFSIVEHVQARLANGMRLVVDSMDVKGTKANVLVPRIAAFALAARVGEAPSTLAVSWVSSGEKIASVHFRIDDSSYCLYDYVGDRETSMRSIRRLAALGLVTTSCSRVLAGNFFTIWKNPSYAIFDFARLAMTCMTMNVECEVRNSPSCRFITSMVGMPWSDIEETKEVWEELCKLWVGTDFGASAAERKTLDDKARELLDVLKRDADLLSDAATLANEEASRLSNDADELDDFLPSGDLTIEDAEIKRMVTESEEHGKRLKGMMNRAADAKVNAAHARRSANAAKARLKIFMVDARKDVRQMSQSTAVAPENGQEAKDQTEGVKLAKFVHDALLSKLNAYMERNEGDKDKTGWIKFNLEESDNAIQAICSFAIW